MVLLIRAAALAVLIFSQLSSFIIFTEAFTVVSSLGISSPGIRPSLLFLGKRSREQPLQFPANEFSRTIDPERVLKRRRRPESSSYNMNIEATLQECRQLAKRFDLPDLSRLSADVNLLNDESGIFVHGTGYATVTRKCVRTNENFEMNVEFPIESLVRPVASVFQKSNLEEDELLRAAGISTRDTPSPNMDTRILQQMLEQNVNDENDILMEDEAIYPLQGDLDVGELVAQLFWLGLDPYPKKPGTDPMSASITG